jgi:hypothetical protein
MSFGHFGLEDDRSGDSLPEDPGGLETDGEMRVDYSRPTVGERLDPTGNVVSEPGGWPTEDPPALPTAPPVARFDWVSAVGAVGFFGAVALLFRRRS